MKSTKLIFLSIALILLCNTVFAQQFELSGEIRPRAEYRNGFNKPLTDAQSPNFFIEQRSRLNAIYKNDSYTFKLVMQDVRTWGSQKQLINNGGLLTWMHEAWAQVKLGQYNNLKIGRQEINLDDQRFMGAVAWTQQARSHDALLYQLSKNDFSLKLGLAYNRMRIGNNDIPYTVPGYKTFQFLYAKKKFDALSASLLFFNNGLNDTTSGSTKTYFTQTLGLNINFLKGKLKPAAAFYYQTGKTNAGLDVSGLMYRLELAYGLSDKSSLRLGLESLSGNDQGTASDKQKAFSPFYGTNHKFNGWMDYFYVGNYFDRFGLQDIYLDFTSKGEKWMKKLVVHYFNSKGTIGTSSQDLSKNLGTEVDVVVARNFGKDINLKIGYSAMFSTESMLALKDVAGNGDKMSTWGWTMLTIKPTFFKTKSDN